jgi:SAM-dependent methyltransferase
VSGFGAVFDEAREGFAAWSPLLWDRIGAATVDAVAVRAGERVLDACCGAGAAALPAARAVGPRGLVDAVDVAPALVAQGRRRADGLPQLRFHTADVATWSAGPYDAVVCVFGVFFLPDVDAGGAHLARLLRPGGRLGVTTWQRGSVEPVVVPFAEAAAAEHRAAGREPPSLARVGAASARVATADGLAGWLGGLGPGGVRVDPVRFGVPLDAERAWAFVTGSGTVALLAGLDPDAVARVRRRYLARLAADGVAAFDVTALVGVGTAPVAR